MAGTRRAKNTRLDQGRSAEPEQREGYKSPSLGEVFRKAGYLELPEATKKAARERPKLSAVTELDILFTSLVSNMPKGDPASHVDTSNETYKQAAAGLKSIAYTIADVKRFFSKLKKNPWNYGEFVYHQAAGAYLSALIVGVMKENDILELNLGSLNMNNIGRNLERGKLVIRGSIGYGLGWDMTGGEIVFNGDAGSSVGFGMHAGRITVNGVARDSIGTLMTGGTIIVNGPCGRRIGVSRTGGRIIINGEEVK
jgi:hypothetical protein